MKCPDCNRRDFIRLALGASAAFAFPFSSLALAADPKAKAKAMILLWMQGGPSQLDTWDPKPGAETGGPFKAIETKLEGTTICEHLPLLSKASDRFSVVRSLHSKDPNHDTARYLLHTGYRVDTTVQHPHLGSLIAKELGQPLKDLPGCVTVGNDPGVGAGYLEPELAPLYIEKVDNPLEDLQLPRGVNKFRLTDREGLLDQQNASFAAGHAKDARVEQHREAQRRALALVRSTHVQAFDVSGEPEETRALYGDAAFGKACLMARRLVAEGVRFVEVTLADWDTHTDNFNRSRKLMEQLDKGFSGLLADLDQKGLLSSTLVVCMGEFGRTPRINAAQGRDHFTRGFSAALAGGGIAGGRAIGRTNDLGTEIKERPVSVQDLFATIYGQLGVDPRREYTSQSGRPIKILDGGEAVKELVS
jgi:uncharacterized protein (DUF1501 family)